MMKLQSIRQRAVTLLALVIGGIVTLGTSAGPVSAQIRDSVVTLASPVTAQPRSVLLDAAINRATYRLGPGDQVVVSIFGDVNRMYSGAVTPEGTIVISTIGVVNVLGMTLDEAQVEVRRAVSRLYRNADARVSIAELRTFKLYVLGDVPSPGMRIANAATRISELVPQLLQPGAATGTVIRRTVKLIRTSGDTLNLDLLPFLLRGDISANPTVHEGDILVVPILDETVRIYGRVAYPGVYEFRRGETLATLLQTVNGGARLPSDAGDTLQVARPRNRTERELFGFTQAEAFGARGRSFALQPFDAVFVPRIGDFMRQQTATIDGQVARPGVYPIEVNVTTARALIDMAGGLLPDASLVSATLRRGGSITAPGKAPLPDESLTDVELRARRALATSDPSNVVVDFQRLIASGGKTDDVSIQPGDVLNIPRRSDDIAVLGAVATPGLLHFVPGRDIDYYIRLAGGALDRADKGGVSVFKAKLRTEVSGHDARTLEPDDQIIVPYKRRTTLMQRIQFVSGVLTGISGVVLTVLAVRQVFK